MNKAIVSRGKFMAQNMELVCRLHQGRTGLEPRYIRVLTGIIAHANYDSGGRSWPSRNRLAKFAGVRRKEVDTILSKLCEWGYIWKFDTSGKYPDEDTPERLSYRLKRDPETQEIDWPPKPPEDPKPKRTRKKQDIAECNKVFPREVPPSQGSTYRFPGKYPPSQGSTYSRDTVETYSGDETLESNTGLQADPSSSEPRSNRSPSQQTPEPKKDDKCGGPVEIRSHPHRAGNIYMPEFIALDAVSFPDGPDTILDRTDRIMVDAKYEKWLAS